MSTEKKPEEILGNAEEIERAELTDAATEVIPVVQEASGEPPAEEVTEDPAADAVAEEASKRSRKRAVLVGLGAVAFVALCIVGVIAIAKPTAEPTPTPPTKEEVAEATKDQTFGLAVNLKADGWTDKATKATVHIEAKAEDGTVEPIEREVACNEKVELVSAKNFKRDVTYTVSVTKMPVLEDGSTYTTGKPMAIKAPSDAAMSKDSVVSSSGFEFDNKRADATVTTSEVSATETQAIININLTPKPVADMSAEEVAASASALEATGNAAAAQSVVQNAPAASGGSNSSAGGSSSGGNTSGGGSSSGGSNVPAPTPTPEPPAHTHSWVAETTTKTVYHNFCGICNDDISGFESSHLEAHALAGEGVGNAYSGAAGTETVKTGRYYCPCGAWQ